MTPRRKLESVHDMRAAVKALEDSERRLKSARAIEPRPWTGPGVHGPYAHDESWVVIRVTSGPDGFGRQSFEMLWWNGWRRRGQNFHAVVRTYIRSFQNANRTVILLGMAPAEEIPCR